MTDINSLGIDTEATQALQLEHPQTGQPIHDKEGKPASIQVVGAESKEWRDISRKNLNRRLRARNATVTAEQLEVEHVALLVACTKGWHLVNFQGEVIDYPFNEANARALYGNPKFAWIRKQVDRFIGDEGNFLKG